LLDATLAFLIAARCVACQQALTAPTRGPVCADCWAAVPWDDRPCDSRPRHVSTLVAAARYDGPMRAIIQAFKYAGHQTLDVPLARRLSDHPALDLRHIDVVVPVPLHPWRRLVRGFNQAERLARHLGPPVLHALSRTHWTPAQASLHADARERNVQDAFALARHVTPGGRRRLRDTLSGARVLLVDDVVTTGGTMSACARVLREAGARDVCAAAVARTEKR
jgi:ComF family protein